MPVSKYIKRFLHFALYTSTIISSHLAPFHFFSIEIVMRFLTLLSGLALATSIAAQTSTGQACSAIPVSRFESCICPYGTDYLYSATYAILGVNAKVFNTYTSSCMYINPSIILSQAVAHTTSPVYDLGWQGVTNLTRSGPDKTVGSSRIFTAPTSVGTLTFSEKVRSPTNPSSMPT